MSVQTQQAVVSSNKQKKENKPKVPKLKTEKPKAEKPKAEKPKVEKPKVEKPKVEKPKAEKVKTEKPKVKKEKVKKEATSENTPSEKPKSNKIVLVSETELSQLDTKNVKELKEYAKAMGLREYSSLKKEDLKNVIDRISTFKFTDDDAKYMSYKLLRSFARGSGLPGYSKAVKKDNILTMIKNHKNGGGVIGFSGTTKAKRGKVITEPFDLRSGPNTYSRNHLQQYANLLDLKGYSDKTSKVSDLHVLVRKAVDDTSQLPLANLKIRALKRTIKLYRKEEPKLRMKGSPEELYAYLGELRRKYGSKSRINHTIRVQYEKGKTFSNKELKSISRQIGVCGFTKMKTKDIEELMERIHENKLKVEDYNLLSLKTLKYMSKYHKVKISKMNEDRRVPMTRMELFEKLTGLKVSDNQVKKKGNPEALLKYKENKNAAKKTPQKPEKKNTKTSAGKKSKK